MTHNSFAKAGAILVGNSVILLIVSDSIRLRECYLLKKQFEYVQSERRVKRLSRNVQVPSQKSQAVFENEVACKRKMH